MEGDIDGFLKEQNIVGIYNIDTRKLTRIIREVGVMNGVITTEDVYAKKKNCWNRFDKYTIKNAVVSRNRYRTQNLQRRHTEVQGGTVRLRL